MTCEACVCVVVYIVVFFYNFFWHSWQSCTKQSLYVKSYEYAEVYDVRESGLCFDVQHEEFL